MFKKLIKYLYKKYCDPDWVQMTRLQLMGTTHGLDPQELKNSQKKQLSKEAQGLLKNEVLLLAFNNVKARIEMHIRNEAPTSEVIFYDRMIINGIELAKEEIQMYANYGDEKQEKMSDTEKFDPL